MYKKLSDMTDEEKRVEKARRKGLKVLTCPKCKKKTVKEHLNELIRCGECD